MSKEKVAILVMTIQKAEKNKTLRYLEKNSFSDFFIMVPSGLDESIALSYGDNAVVYDTDEFKKRCDFMGTNIQNGASVGRLACNDWIRKHTEYDYAVVLDDDYGGVVSDFTTTPTLNNKTFYQIVSRVYHLGKRLGIATGGYSGGAYPNTKNAIMNVWIIDKGIQDRGLDKILNEDVCYSIYNWHRGIATFGFANVIRSGAQTAEMDKVDGNTRMIYQTDRSYRKSFGSVLADPKNGKLDYNANNTKRGALWHHKILWSKMCPKIVLEHFRKEQK